MSTEGQEQETMDNLMAAFDEAKFARDFDHMDALISQAFQLGYKILGDQMQAERILAYVNEEKDV